MKKRIGLQGQLMLLGVLAILFLSRWMFQQWPSEHWEEAVDALGMAFIFLGFVFRMAARGYKAESSDGGHSLVQNGPYQLTRNPMYVGSFLIGTGAIVVALNLAILIIFYTIFALIYIPQISKEEALLTNHFGQSYREYCAKTARFLPKFNFWFTLPKYLRIKLSWVTKEIASMVAVLILTIVIETWSDTRMFGLHEIKEEFFEMSLLVTILSLIVLFLFFERPKSRPMMTI